MIFKKNFCVAIRFHPSGRPWCVRNRRRYAMSDESVILINLLKVKPGKQHALIALLKQNTDTVVRTLHGWKTTRLIAAKDGAGVVIYSEWEAPAAVEAMRSDPGMKAYWINAGSADEAYRSLLKAAFYGDVSESEFAHAASQLHCDESNAGALAPSEITPGRFGTVPRHYIRCAQDRAIPLTGQDHMIATVDRAIGGKTTTPTLETSHSPFLSQTAAPSQILIDICVQSLAEQTAEAQ